MDRKSEVAPIGNSAQSSAKGNFFAPPTDRDDLTCNLATTPIMCTHWTPSLDRLRVHRWRPQFLFYEGTN